MKGQLTICQGFTSTGPCAAMLRQTAKYWPFCADCAKRQSPTVQQSR